MLADPALDRRGFLVGVELRFLPVRFHYFSLFQTVNQSFTNKNECKNLAGSVTADMWFSEQQ